MIALRLIVLVYLAVKAFMLLHPLAALVFIILVAALILRPD